MDGLYWMVWRARSGSSHRCFTSSSRKQMMRRCVCMESGKTRWASASSSAQILGIARLFKVLGRKSAAAVSALAKTKNRFLRQKVLQKANCKITMLEHINFIRQLTRPSVPSGHHLLPVIYTRGGGAMNSFED